MDKQTTYSSKLMKILISFAVVYGIIYLAKSGYAFGQWFHQLDN